MEKETGFDVSKADLLRYQAKQTLELSDEELEGVSGDNKWNTERTKGNLKCCGAC